MKIRNFNKDKNVWEDDNLWKQVKSLSKFNKSMEGNTISQEDMIEKIQTSKNNYSVIYHKDILKTIKALPESYIAKHIQNSRANIMKTITSNTFQNILGKISKKWRDC